MATTSNDTFQTSMEMNRQSLEAGEAYAAKVRSGWVAPLERCVFAVFYPKCDCSECLAFAAL
jgi:hypothetical protein